MTKESSSGGYGIIFLIILVTALVLITAMVRDSNIRKTEKMEKATISNNFLTLGNDVKNIKSTMSSSVSESSQAKKIALEALDVAKKNNDRITALENKNCSAVQEAQPRYVPTSYCTTEYDPYTKMILMRCKDYPTQIIR